MAQKVEKKENKILNIPRTPFRYSSKQEATLIAKCQMYQWMEVQKVPSPHRSRMYTEVIQKQYPIINFNEDLYNQWLDEIVKVYRTNHEQTTENTESKENDETNVSDPDWLSLQTGNINDLLLNKFKVKALSLTDRCLGCLLGVFIVDTLGAPVEGWPYEDIIEKYGKHGVINMIPGTHMGARGKGARCGYYTDDTMTTMALALSLVTNKKLNAQHAAENYYKFWKSNPIYRGLPDSAQKVLFDVIDGMSITITGRQSFADGSYANGGAMRISPIGLTFRNATDQVLKSAVVDAVISSHCHPQSVDGAMCIALMIRYALKCENVKTFDYKEMINIIMNNMETDEMKKNIQMVVDGYEKFEHADDENIDEICEYDVAFLKKTGLLTFQIKAIEAVPFVLYSLLRWYKNPEQCAINVVTLGGDCDTTGSMIGGILGCLYGTRWIPKRWYDNLENTWKPEQDNEGGDEDEINVGVKAYGIDLAQYLGVELAKLDFDTHEKFVEIKKGKSLLGKVKDLVSFKKKNT